MRRQHERCWLCKRRMLVSHAVLGPEHLNLLLNPHSLCTASALRILTRTPCMLRWQWCWDALVLLWRQEVDRCDTCCYIIPCHSWYHVPEWVHMQCVCTHMQVGSSCARWPWGFKGVRAPLGCRPSGWSAIPLLQRSTCSSACHDNFASGYFSESKT